MNLQFLEDNKLTVICAGGKWIVGKEASAEIHIGDEEPLFLDELTGFIAGNLPPPARRSPYVAGSSVFTAIAVADSLPEALNAAQRVLQSKSVFIRVDDGQDLILS